jgi:hypothetical protein
MAKDEQNQKGKQQNAEGMHGDKTHQAVIESLRARKARPAEDGVEEKGSPYGANESDGRHRLSEDREQHDEAEKNSELEKLDGKSRAR